MVGYMLSLWDFLQFMSLDQYNRTVWQSKRHTIDPSGRFTRYIKIQRDLPPVFHTCHEMKQIMSFVIVLNGLPSIGLILMNNYGSSERGRSLILHTPRISPLSHYFQSQLCEMNYLLGPLVTYTRDDSPNMVTHFLKDLFWKLRDSILSFTVPSLHSQSQKWIKECFNVPVFYINKPAKEDPKYASLRYDPTYLLLCEVIQMGVYK